MLQDGDHSMLEIASLCVIKLFGIWKLIIIYGYIEPSHMSVKYLEIRDVEYIQK
jgi:hypothetical protein